MKRNQESNMKSILTWNTASTNNTSKLKNSPMPIPSLFNNSYQNQNQIYQSSPQQNNFHNDYEKQYTPPKSSMYKMSPVTTIKEPIKENNFNSNRKLPSHQRYENNKDLIHSLQNKITELNQEKRKVKNEFNSNI